MLGATLIRYQVVQVREPRKKQLLAAAWMVKPLHREQFPRDGIMAAFPHSLEQFYEYSAS
jgi:hypothetical protein